jgi:hypothetical protein
MKQLTATEVSSRSVTAFGLDSARFGIESVEAIAGALRRAAGFLCPCTERTLVQSVLAPLRGLIADVEAVRSTVESTIEALIAIGDLVEFREVEGGKAAVLYASPRAFVLRSSGAAVLVGVGADGSGSLPQSVASLLISRRHVRQIAPFPGLDLRLALTESGYIELLQDQWLKTPPLESPKDHIARFDRRLQVASLSGELSELVLLDPNSPVTFYPARWVLPRRDAGHFVGKRPQPYGSPLWCYVDMREGRPHRFFDLPTLGSRWRGCDEGWHLQMAIDALRGRSQQFKIQRMDSATTRIDLFSPVPTWAQRRLDIAGDRVAPNGCLASFVLPDSEVKEEINFLREHLWMVEAQ